MKISTAAVALLSLPSTSLAQQCLTGGFRLEFDGACTPEAIVAAYQDQVYGTSGATSSSCASSAQDDLQSKLPPDTTLEDLCHQVYATQRTVPFSNAANRGTDMQFESQFFNGQTNWQEEVETLYETEDLTRTNILKEDAEQVRVFYQGIAQGQRVDWPGALSNFQSSVVDGNGLATCTTNAAMCCWPKDRQANDNNGNCAKEYDENCVDKDPADNTDLCYVDLERGNSSTGFESKDTIIFPGDNNQGEGAIHCHGLAWSNDVNDHTARYKGNNLFFVSMYDHMYQRGYVENIPGAPMCGCVEQMPTVSRSDCTQVDLTETISITYDATSSTFTTRLESVHVDFNACQGINNRNNDLWAYMARLYYQGDITPAQFGEAGRIITNTDCREATSYELNKKGLTPGYDHDVSMWTNVAGRESMELHDGYGARAFNLSMRPGDLPTTENPHYGIIFRACQSCVRTHMKIYYRRRTAIPEDYSLMDTILYRENDGGGRNVWNVDFSLHSTYEDALMDRNAWLCPNGQFTYSATFYGQCSPDGTRVKNQRSRFHVYDERNDVAYFVNKAEDDGLDIIPTQENAAGVVPYTTVIKGRDYAGGMALRDATTGTIYMTGSGRDIWNNNDDFNYLSQPAEGDHTVVVHAGSIASPDPSGWSKSGIMFRTSMDKDSPHFSIFLTGREGVCTQGRTKYEVGSSHWGCVNYGAEEAWLKIEKRMGTYTSFYGTQEVADGPITWTVHKSIELPDLHASGSYNVGLAVSSQRSLAQEVVFTDYEVDAYYFPSAAPSVSIMPTIYVPGLDIGATLAGSASLNDAGEYTVTGAGADIWNGADQFYYVPFTKNHANVQAELYIEDFAPVVNTWQKGGIMFRESLEANSRHVSLFMTGNNGISAHWRSCAGCGSNHETNYNLKSKPVYLQVTKIGHQFSTAYKYDAAGEWIPHSGPHTIEFGLGEETFYVGIAVTSHNTGNLVTLSASDFVVTDLATEEPTRSPTVSPTISPAPTGEFSFLAPLADAAGYKLVYDLDIPANPNYSTGLPAYTVSKNYGAFSRIGYYMELDGEYVWVSMDSFTDDYNKIGVPCIHQDCSLATIQQTLANMNVQSNIPGLEASGVNGNIEFWPWNYGQGNAISIPGASGSTYDFGDTASPNSGDYGSMQIHLSDNSDGIYQGTVFAFNRFNTGSNADVGIGNSVSSNPDWTFAGNAGSKTNRKLQVFVLPTTGTPARRLRG